MTKKIEWVLIRETVLEERVMGFRAKELADKLMALFNRRAGYRIDKEENYRYGFRVHRIRIYQAKT